MMLLKPWSLGGAECPYTQVHSDPECQNLLGSPLWVKYEYDC